MHRISNCFYYLIFIKQDIQECRMGRSLVSAYDKEDCSKYSVTSPVEKCMKKYADTLLRSLEAISGRLSQLEIHFHKLEQSLCELRGDFIQDQSDKDLNFKSLEKHLQEVSLMLISHKCSCLYNLFLRLN